MISLIGRAGCECAPRLANTVTPPERTLLAYVSIGTADSRLKTYAHAAFLRPPMHTAQTTHDQRLPNATTEVIFAAAPSPAPPAGVIRLPQAGWGIYLSAHVQIAGPLPSNARPAFGLRVYWAEMRVLSLPAHSRVMVIRPWCA